MKRVRNAKVEAAQAAGVPTVVAEAAGAAVVAGAAAMAVVVAADAIEATGADTVATGSFSS